MAELEEIRQRRAAAWERAQEVGSGGNWRSHTEEVEDFTWKSASFRKLKCFFFRIFHGFSGFDMVQPFAHESKHGQEWRIQYTICRQKSSESGVNKVLAKPRKIKNIR
jgi:hypothetical protein